MSPGSVTMCPFEQANVTCSSRPSLDVPSDHWRAFGVGFVAVTPLHEREHDVHQLTALVRQAVFHPCPAAGFAVLRALEDPLLDEENQTLGQQVARALQDPVKLLEPWTPREETRSRSPCGFSNQGAPPSASPARRTRISPASKD
jgi:hypothetical protein